MLRIQVVKDCNDALQDQGLRESVNKTNGKLWDSSIQCWGKLDHQRLTVGFTVTVGAASLAPWRRAFAALANFGDPEAFHDFHFDI